MTDFAWTPGAGAYKHYPQYVNLTGTRLTVRGAEFPGEDGHWRMGHTVSIDLPQDVLNDLARAAIQSLHEGEGELRGAVIEARIARLNWQKYNGNKADEIVYQAEKMASAIDKIDASLAQSSMRGVD